MNPAETETPPPPHALFKPSRLATVLLAGTALWLLPMAALFFSDGWSGTLMQIGWFFTKAALLTFGGAYAVLPYVNQAAVEHYQWLSTAQMMDGLALGETTPGPLIMVVAQAGRDPGDRGFGPGRTAAALARPGVKLHRAGHGMLQPSR